MKVLITGGCGFIGSHLAEYYEKNGDTVTVIDNLSTGSSDNLKDIDFKGEHKKGDIRDSQLIEELVENADLVLHMAAALGVDNIMRSTLESISTNIVGSEVVLKAASKFKKRILIASTSEIYGKNPKQPLSENDDRVVGTPQNIRWSYSDAKAIEEAMARSLNLESVLAVTTVRLFNTVGPRQTGRYGMVIPRFVASAVNGEDVVVYGDGNQSRVFCHVNDAVSAITKLIENEETVGEVYNIGGTEEISINELAKKIIRETSSNSHIKRVPYSEIHPVGFEDMQRRVPNIEKIMRTIQWAPSKNLSDIIKDVALTIKKKNN
jgi:UDP-glucose 4-epimerase